MEIKEKSREFTKTEIYKLTKSPSMIPVNNVEDGSELEVNGYLIFGDINSKDEPVEILSVLGTDGTVWCSQSDTFRKNFMDIYSIFEGETFTIVKLSGETKAGRPFVNCDLKA